MISTREQFRDVIGAERPFYVGTWAKDRFVRVVTHDVSLSIYRFVYLLRKPELHHNRPGALSKLRYAWYRRRKNKLGERLGIEIWDNSFDVGLSIYHAGNIVVNGNARIGRNCRLHGSNCIGNDGRSEGSPIIGDNVRLGVGAKVIGAVTIADNVTIAAGAVVVDSFTEEGVTIGGVPARKIK
jgi:serine O-acetyltransferase